MSTIEERTAYLQNPYFNKPIYGDFTPFYITIAICTVICFSLILLNVICACCSQYSKYWQSRHTGNRWLVTLWTATPHKQPPLDLTELKAPEQIYDNYIHYKTPKQEIIEIEGTEPIPLVPTQRPLRPEFSQSLLKKAEPTEHKRESDI